jgi:hypothetical protein
MTGIAGHTPARAAKCGLDDVVHPCHLKTLHQENAVRSPSNRLGDERRNVNIRSDFNFSIARYPMTSEYPVPMVRRLVDVPSERARLCEGEDVPPPLDPAEDAVTDAPLSEPAEVALSPLAEPLVPLDALSALPAVGLPEPSLAPLPTSV